LDEEVVFVKFCKFGSDQLTTLMIEVIPPEPPVVAFLRPERRGAGKGEPSSARRSEPLHASTVLASNARRWVARRDDSSCW
jgi:hypothetical protein